MLLISSINKLDVPKHNQGRSFSQSNRLSPQSNISEDWVKTESMQESWLSCSII